MKILGFSVGNGFRLMAVLALASLHTVGMSVAQAQTQIPDFIASQQLTNTNLGRASIAIQRTCGGLIMGGLVSVTGQLQGNELWRRCNELVVTAGELENGTPAPNMRALGYTADDELLAAFQQVSGEEVQASANLSQTASYDQFSTIGARLAALRGGASASIASVAANSADFMIGSGGGASADTALPFGSWGWFIRGTYASGERDPSAATGFAGEENGFDYDQYGVTVGIDKISGNSVWGFAIGYSDYEVEMQSASAGAGIATQAVDGGTIESDSLNATFFYDLSTANRTYFTALAGFGSQSFDMARNFVYFAQIENQALDVVDQRREMLATPDGDSLSFSLTLGRMLERGSVLFDPYVGINYERVNIDRFAETDSGNLASSASLGGMQLEFNEQEIDSLRATLGIQISNNVNTSFGSVRPMLSAEWYHEFEDDPRVIQARYALEADLASDPVAGAFFTDTFGNCRSCFDIISEEPDTDYFVVGLGVAATTRQGLQSFVMLEGLLGHSYLSAIAVTVGIRGQF